MLGVQAFPSLIFALFCIGLPESPRWLITYKNDLVGGMAVFKKVDPTYTESELSALVAEIASSGKEVKLGGTFFSKGLMRPIFLAFFVAFFNQLSGINAILYFAPRIFEMTGLQSQAALLQSVGIGVTMLVFTFIGLWLIDRLGRRTLLYIGSFGYILSLGITSWAFANGYSEIIPFFIFVFIAAHGIGQGAVIWVLISEIFPNKYRAFGQTLGSFTHWFFAALITLFFPILAENLAPQYIFGIFFVMMILQLIWVHFFVPETKGISLEEMHVQMSK